MEYSKDTMPDGTVYENYEGTPEEIMELMNFIGNEDAGLEYSTEDAIDFINRKFKINKEVIARILRLEEDYMRSVGIIGY